MTSSRINQTIANHDEEGQYLAMLSTNHNQEDTFSVESVAQARIPTADGEFQLHVFLSNQDSQENLAFVMGDIYQETAVLTRVHSECFTGDVMGSLRCDCGVQLDWAMKQVSEAGTGVILYLRQEGRSIGLINKLKAYNLQDQGYDTVDANLALGHQADERDYTIAVLMLKQLGVKAVRLMTNNPRKVDELRRLGMPVLERIPTLTHVTEENRHYLQTKIQRMKHTLILDNTVVEGEE